MEIDDVVNENSKMEGVANSKMEIDSDSNVVVQRGKNYIMKYIRKEVSP